MKNKLLPVPEGYKAIVHHAFKDDDIEFWERLTHTVPPTDAIQTRYMSVVDIMDTTTGELMATGIAKCKFTDNPSRKLGRLIAHNRAVEQFVNRRKNGNC